MEQMGLELEVRERPKRSMVPLAAGDRREMVALLAAAIVAVFRQEKEVRDDHASADAS